jgi:hypothetical protein
MAFLNMGEAVWFPTALLPGAGVEWSGFDDHNALAILTDCGTTVSLEFRFNGSCEVAATFTPGRYRENRGEYELTPWEAHYQHYVVLEGMRIPGEADAEWIINGKSTPYIKVRTLAMSCDFVELG